MTYLRLGQLYAELDQDVEVSGDVEVYCLMQLQIEQPVVDKQVCNLTTGTRFEKVTKRDICFLLVCVWIMFIVDMRSFETP